MRVRQVDMVDLKYTDLPGGILEWQDPKMNRPLPFDLVELKTNTKTITGWWTGNDWMGLRLRKGDKVKSWKKSRELDFI